MPVVKGNLGSFADALDACERFGTDVDRPEGSRFITMSDTMATALAAELREINRERLEWLSGKVWTPEGASDATMAPEAVQAPAGDAIETEMPPKVAVYADRAKAPVFQPKAGMPGKQKVSGTLKRFKNDDY
jgi:hypothetical protein